VQISSFIWPLLIHLYVHSGGHQVMSPRCPLKANGPTLYILNYMFPYLQEKQVLEITRKVIFTVACSSVTSPVRSQLRWAEEPLRVGKRTTQSVLHTKSTSTSVTTGDRFSALHRDRCGPQHPFRFGFSVHQISTESLLFSHGDKHHYSLNSLRLWLLLRGYFPQERTC